MHHTDPQHDWDEMYATVWGVKLVTFADLCRPKKRKKKNRKGKKKCKTGHKSCST